VMRLGGVEVQRARAAFTADGRAFAAGSWVIPMAQPASGFAKTLLERQRYPDIRQYPGGPVQRPYDVTAHTLPLLLGVDVTAAATPFEVPLEPAAAGVVPGQVSGRGPWLAMGHRSGELVALGRLLRAGVPVRWATAAFTEAGRRFAAGTLLVPGSARSRLDALARELGISARAVAAAPAAMSLRVPRVGVYQSWVPAIDEGWTRFVFEKQMEVAYETLHDRDVQAGGLRDRFDAIVVPSQSPGAITSGWVAGTMPAEYTGGLGAKGMEALRAFAEAGGTLVMLDASSRLALRDLGLGVRDALADAGDFYCPGALLRVQTVEHPLTAGLDSEAAIWFEESPAFEVETGTVLARYTDGRPLLSGWLSGGERLSGKAALVEVPLGRGRVVLFGFRPQYRAQSWATYPALLNALYTSAAAPVATPGTVRPRPPAPAVPRKRTTTARPALPPA